MSLFVHYMSFSNVSGPFVLIFGCFVSFWSFFLFVVIVHLFVIVLCLLIELYYTQRLGPRSPLTSQAPGPVPSRPVQYPSRSSTNQKVIGFACILVIFLRVTTSQQIAGS